MSASWSGSPDRGALALQSASRLEQVRGRPVAFVDRDGTLNETMPDPQSGLPESPLNIEDVRLLPHAAAAIRSLAAAGYAVVCVTNQPAAAKGKVALEDLLSVHERVLDLLAAEGACLDASRLCPHHPDGVVSSLSGSCECRKPAPGMLFDAAVALGSSPCGSWMLGDTDADVQAGRAAGSHTVLIEYPPSAHKRTMGAAAEVLVPDVVDGVAWILAARAAEPQTR